jgi:hypothetical protein
MKKRRIVREMWLWTRIVMMTDIGLYKEFGAGQLVKPKFGWRWKLDGKFNHKWLFKRSE